MSDSRRAHASLWMTVDLVILTVREGSLHVLLIERGKEPFLGRRALPGGFLREDEDLRRAAIRELREETGLDGDRLHLEQVGTYSDPGRDPRGRVITAAYLAIAPDLPVPVADTDARWASWMPVEKLSQHGTLAFDHNQILDDAVERARGKLEHTTLATAFCAESFTMRELRQVYEMVWGVPLDPRNFARKVTGTDGFVVPTGETRRLDAGRPAVLYRPGPATTLYPPMLRAGVS